MPRSWLRIESDGRRHDQELAEGRTTIGGTGGRGERPDVNVGAFLPPGPQVAIIVWPDRVLAQSLGGLPLSSARGDTASGGESIDLRPGEPVQVGQVTLSIHAARPEASLSIVALAAVVLICALAGVGLVRAAGRARPAPGPTAQLVLALRSPGAHAPQATALLRSAALAHERGACAEATSRYRAAWEAAAGDRPLQALAEWGVAHCRDRKGAPLTKRGPRAFR